MMNGRMELVTSSKEKQVRGGGGGSFCLFFFAKNAKTTRELLFLKKRFKTFLHFYSTGSLV